MYRYIFFQVHIKHLSKYTIDWATKQVNKFHILKSYRELIDHNTNELEINSK